MLRPKKKITRKEIQNEVDALHLNRKYLLLILDSVSIYFPIIEKILKEENIPDDFKYLSIQESSLISDAQSSSNAVGFWQFKSETAKSFGLQINKYVDERLNIISSTNKIEVTRTAPIFIAIVQFYNLVLLL